MYVASADIRGKHKNPNLLNCNLGRYCVSFTCWIQHWVVALKKIKKRRKFAVCGGNLELQSCLHYKTTMSCIRLWVISHSEVFFFLNPSLSLSLFEEVIFFICTAHSLSLLSSFSSSLSLSLSLSLLYYLSSLSISLYCSLSPSPSPSPSPSLSLSLKVTFYICTTHSLSLSLSYPSHISPLWYIYIRTKHKSYGTLASLGYAFLHSPKFSESWSRRILETRCVGDLLTETFHHQNFHNQPFSLCENVSCITG